MSTSVTTSRPVRPRPHSRVERRRLDRCDALSARLAELHAIGDVLTRAADLVGRGWVQGGWFSVATPGGEVALTAYDVRMVRDHPVTGACLVGSLVHAAGGPEQARSQLVQRTLDLTWHALRDDGEQPAVLCPSPPVRALRLLDLTRWNDAPARTCGDVVDLLTSTRSLASAQADAGRAEREALTPLA
ncbi:MAG TPA: hypothetical protein VFJ89_06955 [Nocardioides sp.]|nr:hypothetical protein [Nocardioides sp.]